MSSHPEGSPPPPRAELSSDRCPNCGRPLKFPENRAEGLCASCGIYVEILKPLPAPGHGAGFPPPFDRGRVLAATRRDLEGLCRDHGLSVAGSKPDLVARLLEFLPGRGGGSRPTSGGPESSPGPPVPEEVEDVAKRAEMALFFLDLDQTLGDAEEAEEEAGTSGEHVTDAAIQTTKPAAPEAPARAPGPAAAQAETTAAKPTPTSESPPKAVTTEAIPIPPPSPEPEPGPLLPPEEDEFDWQPPPPEPEAAPEPPVEVGEEAPTATVTAADEADAVPSGIGRDRAVFYVGMMLVVMGGSGLLLGSLLHDVFRVPLFGGAFETFGPLNVMAAVLGGLIFVAGLGAMAFGLRGGIVRRKATPGV